MFANIGFPGSINFISEFLIFIGIIPKLNIFFVILLGIGFITSLLYSIWIYNKIFLGTFSNYLNISYDLNNYEYYILFTLAILVIFFGFFPMLLLQI